ncbi:hypothetical protein AWC02_02840 [Mycolicibacter engbaekii]|uniref:Secreted protein n=1 Tax=Mycolicibacter engbaekii TaxID=188915 RepID=A0A1X1U541_9MYCO|nr:DUF6636 domain-containing protein [Mycolicibacter engbaekii]ORV51798.1 hypothetical protein AWC02_02840 [Mycolicibacter engbaekii]
MGYPVGVVASAAAVMASVGIIGAPVAAAQPDIYFVVSPSGNIACAVGPDWVRCDIQDRDWSPPPRPSDCPSQTGYGQGIQLDAYGKAQFVCAGDTTFGGDARTLKYGERDSTTTHLCTSETSGIRCENRDDHGFIISRESYELF